VKFATPVGFHEEVTRCKTDESDVCIKFVKHILKLGGVSSHVLDNIIHVIIVVKFLTCETNADKCLNADYLTDNRVNKFFSYFIKYYKYYVIRRALCVYTVYLGMTIGIIADWSPSHMVGKIEEPI